MKWLLYIGFFLLLQSFSWQPIVKSLTLELPPNTSKPRFLAKDNRGIVWIACKEGVFAYDGRQAIANIPTASAPTAILVNDTLMFIGCEDGSVNVHDLLSGKFLRSFSAPNNMAITCFSISP